MRRRAPTGQFREPSTRDSMSMDGAADRSPGRLNRSLETSLRGLLRIGNRLVVNAAAV